MIVRDACKGWARAYQCKSNYPSEKGNSQSGNFRRIGHWIKRIQEGSHYIVAD